MTPRHALRPLLCLALTLPATPARGQEVPPAAAGLATVHAADSPAAALARLDQLATLPKSAELGIDYLRGSLLEALGRREAAARAFATAMRRAPLLAGPARYRLARLELPAHPEIAAGLLAPLLVASSPPELRHQAAVLLRLALARGGDCRLLEQVEWSALAVADRRALQVRRADCARSVAPRQAAAQLTALLASEPGDEAAREAALRLIGLDQSPPAPDLALALGRAFHRHGRPDLASAFLDTAVRRLPPRLLEEREVETLELLAETQVRRGDLAAAAASFARLAQRVHRHDLRARALYHEGWVLELLGRADAALVRYLGAAALGPPSEATPAALLAACRTQWRLGQQEQAWRSFQQLRARPEWSQQALRAALFLAASRLAAGAEDGGQGAGPLLEHAAQLAGGATAEILYWSARLAEAQRRRPLAAASYARLVRELPYHPLAGEARRRLAGPAMAATLAASLEAWRHSPQLSERLQAWLLLPPDDPRREPLRLFLYQTYARDRELAPLLRLAAVPPHDWPLWRGGLHGVEERLLALGGWREVGLEVVQAHFPDSNPPLAFTAAQRLLAAGDLTRSVRVGEQLLERSGARIPLALLPRPLRELVFPRPWAQRVLTAAGRHHLDPALLWGLMRAGSGFDPSALSPWGGRGLLLVDPRDAERLAPLLGLPPLDAERLFDPRLAIPVGAARLAELANVFPDRPELALAAYLSGSAQARLWGSWCETHDPAELLSKVGAEDARTALVQVLSARAAYVELEQTPP